MRIKFLAERLAVIISVLTLTNGYTRCTSSLETESIDCYNGNCTDVGECVCHQGWTGENCHECEGRVLLTSNSGFITDGHTDYGREKECSWLLQPKQEGMFKIRLRLLEFATECGWDYLYVYDGDSAFSPLLASFNGLGAIGKETTYRPEIVASSGKAFIHFFSDAQYTMKGFNLSYDLFSCPQNCSGHGICNSDTTCACDAGWVGEACEVAICPSNCTMQGSDGYCFNVEANSVGDCRCMEEDSDCSSTSSLGTWDLLNFLNSSSTLKRASHAGVIYKDTMWLYGGIQFGNPPFSNDLHIYNFTSAAWDRARSDSPSPNLRYGHSMVLNDTSIYVFGGREVLSGRTSDELWIYDIKMKSWTQVSYQRDSTMTLSQNSSSLALWGHTGTIVELVNGRIIMIVMFGFQTESEFSGFVWEYDLENETWAKVETRGALVEGSYGHTATWDPASRMCFVHGGFSRIRSEIYGISESLYSYQPDSKTFKILRPSGVPRFLHSSVLIDNLLLVYGGCAHNDTSQSTGALCFSPSFMSYHTICDKWRTLPDVKLRDSGKYGHVALPYQESSRGSVVMVLSGGYNGELLPDTLLYQIRPCSTFSSNKSCSESHPDLSCVWNVSTSTCNSFSNAAATASCANDDKSYCERISSCTSCKNAHQDCIWCGARCTAADNCRDTPTNCSSDMESHCQIFRTCQQCELNERCQWVENRCNPQQNPANATCFDTCGMQMSCNTCLGQSKQSCMWCTNRQVCVSSGSYVVQFPYGECMEWITKKDQCPAKTVCGEHKTCASCLSDPFCGWCDDGSRTGLGTCYSGTSSGAGTGNSTQNVLSYGLNTNEDMLCHRENWYFTTCPVCQCNGHSTCRNGTSECISCKDQTTGKQCEMCIDGFFGQSLNGGKCKPCQCFGRADTCDRSTGACLCNTKGMTGDKCEKCDTQSKYYGDPAVNNGTCYYRLLINYSFTFTLTVLHDRHITAINFENTPLESGDAELKLETVESCDVVLKVAKYYEVTSNADGSNGSLSYSIQVEEITVAKFLGVTSVIYEFSGSTYGLGNSATNATIRIYVSNFTSPEKIQVSLIQKNNTLLVLLLILFSSFLALLMLVALLWKLKMLFDAYQQRRQHAEQLEQMATRPFATVFLDMDEVESSPQIDEKDIRVATEEVSECGKFSVSTVALWLPYSGESEAPQNKKLGMVAMGSSMLLNQKPTARDASKPTDQNRPQQRKRLKILFKNVSKSRRNTTSRGNPRQSSIRQGHYNVGPSDSVRYSSSNNRDDNRRTEGSFTATPREGNTKAARIESFSTIAPKSNLSRNNSHASNRDAVQCMYSNENPASAIST